jgi:hypothetical protein
MMNVHRLGVVCALALGCVGCDPIRLTTVETQDTVIARRSELLPGSGALTRAEIDGATVYLETFRNCDVVEMQQVRRVAIRESDEDLPEEIALLSLSTVPLTTGAVLIADAPNVYADDRSARQYNSTGEEGALIAGGIVLGIGAIIAVPTLVQLFRVAAAGEETTNVLEQQGAILERAVPCEGRMDPIRTTVVVRAGAKHVRSLNTDGKGQLALDLAEVIPADVAAQQTMASVSVGGNVVAEVDMAIVRAAIADRPRTPVMATGDDVDGKLKKAEKQYRDKQRILCLGSCTNTCGDDLACGTRCLHQLCPALVEQLREDGLQIPDAPSRPAGGETSPPTGEAQPNKTPSDTVDKPPASKPPGSKPPGRGAGN